MQIKVFCQRLERKHYSPEVIGKVMGRFASSTADITVAEGLKALDDVLFELGGHVETPVGPTNSRSLTDGEVNIGGNG